MPLPLRILIVEDSEDDVLLILRELKRSWPEVAYHRVMNADDMKKALANDTWDVVISDHHMPSFSSIEALQVLRESGLDLPFIIVSGQIGEDVAVMAMKAGAHDYIMKSNLTRLSPAIEREMKEARERWLRRRAEEDLIASEANYRTLVENLGEGVALCDAESNFIFANPAAHEIFGVEKVGLKSKSFRDFLDEDGNLLLDRELLDIKSGLPSTFEIDIIRPSGERRNILVTATARSSAIDKYEATVAIFRDMTEQRRAEEAIRYLSLHDQLTDFYNLAYFENELERLQGRSEYPITIITFLVDGIKLINQTMGHKVGDEILLTASKMIANVCRKEDLLARVSGDVFAGILTHSGEDVAISISENLYFELNKYSRENGSLPLSLTVGFETVSDSTISLELAYRRAQKNMYQKKLLQKDGGSGILNALVTALGAKDYATQGHTVRVRQYASLLGKLIGLSAREIIQLELVAEIHDLGKVGIPDSILNKPGPLNTEERVKMQEHVTIGFKIARTSEELVDVSDLILHHHERWDGSGYPDHLCGEDIPIACRIIAIADAYDAMTNDRPYRQALSPEDAVKEILRFAGKQFDPHLANKFAELIANNRHEGAHKTQEDGYCLS